MDIHNYDRELVTAKKRVERLETSERNKQLILSFVDDLVLENLSKPRLLKYLVMLGHISKTFKKDFDTATIQDVKQIVAAIQQRGDYSPWTKQLYKVIIRRFYKWMKGTKDYPDIVSWISIRIGRSEKRLPSEGELLTEAEIQKLIANAYHPRDKAFIAMLWESGARIGEIGNLCLKHIAFDKFGTVIAVQGKTGSRKIRLISSTPYLATWINAHPFKHDSNAALWLNVGTTNNKKPMHYDAMRFLLTRLFKKAGVNKRCNPHIFRHSRATFMANHLTEFQMNQYFGWIQGSGMPSTYVHMSGKEVNNAILAMNGIRVDNEKKDSRFQPLICPKCDTINTCDSKHCNKCGGIIDLKYALELEAQQEKEIAIRKDSDRLMDVLLKDKDVQALLAEKLRALSSNALQF